MRARELPLQQSELSLSTKTDAYLKFWMTKWTSLSLIRLRQNSAAAKPSQILSE